MIVIQQPTLKVPLPQLAGPGTSHACATATGSTNTTSAVFDGPANGATMTQPTSATGRPLRTRTMARSASLFHPTLGESLLSSRSTSPLTSVSSQRSSPGLAATSTPASTVLSSSTASGTGRRAKGIGGSSMLPPPSPLPSQSSKGKSTVCDDPAAIVYDVPVDVPAPSFARPSNSAPRDLARVWEAVANARRIVVICGAGISVSSPANIPDFRSAHGLFRKLKEKHPNVGLQSGKDLFDANLFNSPSTSTAFYSMVSELKAMADAASPTAFHYLLKRLDVEGRLMRVYTQNIDGLEEKAGLTFGLGEMTGDSRSALRGLGKRKREAANAMQRQAGGLSRSQSDSAVLLGRSAMASDDELVDEPMFPRAIPLHGSLSTMTCRVCSHKVYLSLASPGPQRLPPRVRELSPDASDQAVSAMDLLSQGEPVACKRCESHEQVRSVAGLRSRGVGMMKVDVVLYNGQNEGAERVGDCVERDILGLRDPNETSVPESQRERMLRERRERKEEQTAASVAASQLEASCLDPIQEASTADEAFAFAFNDDDGGEAYDARMADEALRLPKAQPQKKTIKRQARLKPLPPDLLIVAGTSLKVPGTKRIVREFAKACQARDYREYPSSDEGSGDEKDDDTSSKSRRSRSNSPRVKRGGVKKESDGEDVTAEDDEDDEDDPNAPIRTILLNYDFPVPPGQWEDVFDVWVQGDVQQAALGLWEASKYPKTELAGGADFSMRRSEEPSEKEPAAFRGDLSWSAFQDVLEMERKAAKKAASATSKKSTSASQSLPSSQTSVSSGKKGKGKFEEADVPVSSQSSQKASPKKANASASSAKQGATKKGAAVAAATAGKTKAAVASSPKSTKKKSLATASTVADELFTDAPVSPVKKKVKKPAKAPKPSPLVAPDASLTKYMKASKASVASSSVGSVKGKKVAQQL